MMMDCPRCNFQQPPDRYCANCGLDIESYNRRPKSLLFRLKKFSKNPILYVALAVVLLAGAGVLISKAFRPKVSEPTLTPANMAQPEPAQNPAVAADPQAAQAPPQADLQRADESSEVNAKSTADTQAAQSQALAQLGSAGSEGQTAGTASDTSAAVPPAADVKEYSVQFYEFERGELTGFQSGAKALTSPRGAKVVLVPDKEKLHGSNLQVQTLNGGGRAKLNEPMSLNFGGETFVLDVRPTKGSVENSALELEVEVIWHAGKADEVRVSGTYSLTTQGGLLIAGVIPHQVAQKPEGLDGPLQILNSPDFQQNGSEFVIAITLN